MDKPGIKVVTTHVEPQPLPPTSPAPRSGARLVPSKIETVTMPPIPPQKPPLKKLRGKVIIIPERPFDGSDNRGYQSQEGVVPLGAEEGGKLEETLLRHPASFSIPDCIPPLEVVAAFLDAAVDNVHTRRSYHRHLAHALGFFRVDDLRSLSGRDLAAYRADLMADGRGVATHSQALAALRAFLRWVCGTFGVHQFSAPILEATLRSPRSTVVRPYQVLTDVEVDRILQVTRTPRNRAIVLVLLGAGLRVAELVALDVQDLHSDVDGGDVLHVRGGKGAKDRMVPVHQEVGHAVHQYLLVSGRTTSSHGPLFLAQDSGRLHRPAHRVGQRGIRKLILMLTVRAGIAKRISPHSFRHTYAIRALRFSGNAVAVSKLLGHASVATTQTYLNHLGLGELRAAVPHIPSCTDLGSQNNGGTSSNPC